MKRILIGSKEKSFGTSLTTTTRESSMRFQQDLSEDLNSMKKLNQHKRTDSQDTVSVISREDYSP